MQPAKKTPSIVVVGSVAMDDIATPAAKRTAILGGSASYACAAASFFTRPGMVGVVGTDFPDANRELYAKFGIDLTGLQTEPGKTFHWAGEYEANMDNRRTLQTDLNVFAGFNPILPEEYRSAPYLILGNIAPPLQLRVLEQVNKPRFIIADTMDLWIKTAREDLDRLIKRVDLLTINESEARLWTGEQHLLPAAKRLMGMGPAYVLIKKGENGSMLFSRSEIRLMSAYPLAHVVDPTGAGDAFAGALVGALAERGVLSTVALHQAMLYGSVVASFGVEDFSLDRLASLSRMAIDARVAELRHMMALPDLGA